jgi:PPOX class probable F420-dependent enzyme
MELDSWSVICERFNRFQQPRASFEKLMPLSKAQLKLFLKETRLAHLATASIDGKPRVSPIWFVYANENCYFTTRMGRLKGRHMQQNPHIALSVASDKRPYKAVCAFGTALLLPNGRDEWLRKIGFRYGRRDGKVWLQEALRQPDHGHENLTQYNRISTRCIRPRSDLD